MTTPSEAGSAQPKFHWAFEPIRPTVPPPDPSGWSENAIDRFIAAKHRAQRLKPGPPADARAFVRRLYFDLIGLPPEPETLAAFEDDPSPDAIGRLAERLLASPRYGERWGRHWMDVVRYADTAGDNADYPIPEIRLYRDYIISSFNQDKPYDQFVREQLAGDHLAPAGPRELYAERVVATGFLALSRRYATAPYELWHLTLEDAIETTGRAFMGLTMRCARCHDHKYDPITKEDYYALYGFFESTQFPYAGSEEFQSKSFPRSGFQALRPDEEAEPLRKDYQKEIDQLKQRLQETEKSGPTAMEVARLKTAIESKTKELQQTENSEALQTELALLQKTEKEAGAKLQQELKVLREQLAKLQKPGRPEGLKVAYAVQDGPAVDAQIQMLGDPAQKGVVVKRAFPKFLAGGHTPEIPEGASGRLALADWLTRPDHPLTARVMVNRVWQHHFGKGLVGSPSNFGLRGDEPTHPELLDYLADYFVREGWSIKALHRLIVSSKTYQLASAHDSSNASVDPANRWYWRFDRRRLEAEPIRDAMLAAAGQLDLRWPGEHPFTPVHRWTFTQHAPFKAVFDNQHRSVYLMTQRIQRHPYLALFDGPDPNTTTEARTQSTVPMQALFMMNHPFVQAQASRLAERLASFETGDRIDRAYELTWARKPADREHEQAEAYLRQVQAELTRNGVEGEACRLESWTSLARILLTANEFIYVD